MSFEPPTKRICLLSYTSKIGGIQKCNNYIDGIYVVPSTGEYIEITNPANGTIIGHVAVSNVDDVEQAITSSQKAFTSWSAMTVKARVAILLKFHSLVVNEYATELAECIVHENGKNITEAIAEVAKGAETVEYACSLPQLIQGKILRVSTGVTCEDQYRPLGVVTSIVPFNFPFMVPMWTIPIALAMGNTVILKPSEKVPITMYRVLEIFEKAGLPHGVLNIIQGTKDAVQALLVHPTIQAVTFVGSSPVANIVATTCRQHNKRVTALGGAKNHLITLSDAPIDATASDITVSFAGCAGQRCMAASVLLTIGSQPELITKIVQLASAIEPGQHPGQMGPVIDTVSYNKIVRYIQDAEENDNVTILLDGRKWIDRMKAYENTDGGNWIGPTILKHKSSSDKAIREEIFGPVLSIYECSTWEEAIEIENTNPFGNAASIYTTNGANADWFISRFRAAMLGCNIGIPVPREPFSFGGLYGTQSKYGDFDITGDGAISFFSNRIKISSKWPLQRDVVATTTNGNVTKSTDAANFAGSM